LCGAVWPEREPLFERPLGWCSCEGYAEPVRQCTTVRAGIANAELAMDEYSKELGRRVRSEEIQNVVQHLQGANIIMRLGHGAYTVVDSFVREMWLVRKAQLSSAD
jgi:hypothetical protein